MVGRRFRVGGRKRLSIHRSALHENKPNKFIVFHYLDESQGLLLASVVARPRRGGGRRARGSDTQEKTRKIGRENEQQLGYRNEGLNPFPSSFLIASLSLFVFLSRARISTHANVNSKLDWEGVKRIPWYRQLDAWRWKQVHPPGTAAARPARGPLLSFPHPCPCMH